MMRELDQDNEPITGNRAQAADAPESPMQRVMRLYAGEGGALIGWLFDECQRKGQTFQEMATELGVTYGYINQLRNGIRRVEGISQNFAENCARYLGVPTIVVKLLSSIRMRDFAFPYESEEQLVDRGMRRVLNDPQARQALPVNVESLPLDAKKALLLFYSEATSIDVFGLRQLPVILQYLQRSAIVEDENAGGDMDTRQRAA